MERLTKRGTNGVYFEAETTLQNVYDRLAAYENTELSPEEIEELKINATDMEARLDNAGEEDSDDRNGDADRDEVLKALDLYEHTPNGNIVDADTILADAMQKSDPEVTGIGEEAMNIWLNSNDRKSFEALFELLTDKSFDEYVKECVEKASREYISGFEVQRKHSIVIPYGKFVKMLKAEGLHPRKGLKLSTALRSPMFPS